MPRSHRLFSPKQPDLDATTRKRYQKTVEMANRQLDSLLPKGVVGNDPVAYLCILQQVFLMNVSSPSLDKDKNRYNVQPSTKANLTGNPETTAISFLVFADRLLKNQAVVDALENANLLQTNDKTGQFTEQLNQLVGILGGAMNVRADYKEFDNKAFIGVMAGLVASLAGVIGFAMGGPIGLAIAGGVVACVAALAYLASMVVAPHGKDKSLEKLQTIEKDANQLLRDDKNNPREDVKGFVQLLTNDASLEDGLENTNVFRL